MKKMFLTLAVFGILLGSCSQKQTTEPAIPVDAEIEKKVEETLSRMTLEEKIGQMTEITLDVFGKKGTYGEAFEIDEAKLDTAIYKYKIGSILNVPGVGLKRERWNELITLIQQKSMDAMGIWTTKLPQQHLKICWGTAANYCFWPTAVLNAIRLNWCRTA